MQQRRFHHLGSGGLVLHIGGAASAGAVGVKLMKKFHKGIKGFLIYCWLYLTNKWVRKARKIDLSFLNDD